MIKTLNNLVAIKPFPSDEIRLKDGNKLYLANVFEEYLNARTAGIVVGLPDRLKFSDDMYAVSMPWKTELELQEGDRVVFNYLADKNSKGLGYFFEDGVMCVPYEQIYVAFRGDDMICLNGFIIVEPDEDEIKTIPIKSDVTIEYPNKRVIRNPTINGIRPLNAARTKILYFE